MAPGVTFLQKTLSLIRILTLLVSWLAFVASSCTALTSNLGHSPASALLSRAAIEVLYLFSSPFLCAEFIAQLSHPPRTHLIPTNLPQEILEWAYKTIFITFLILSGTMLLLSFPSSAHSLNPLFVCSLASLLCLIVSRLPKTWASVF